MFEMDTKCIQNIFILFYGFRFLAWPNFTNWNTSGLAAFATRNPKDIGAVADRFAASKILDHELSPLGKIF